MPMFLTRTIARLVWCRQPLKTLVSPVVMAAQPPSHCHCSPAEAAQWESVLGSRHAHTDASSGQEASAPVQHHHAVCSSQVADEWGAVLAGKEQQAAQGAEHCSTPLTRTAEPQLISAIVIGSQSVMAALSYQGKCLVSALVTHNTAHKSIILPWVALHVTLTPV